MMDVSVLNQSVDDRNDDQETGRKEYIKVNAPNLYKIMVMRIEMSLVDMSALQCMYSMSIIVYSCRNTTAH
jgi:hypothetical protein